MSLKRLPELRWMPGGARAGLRTLAMVALLAMGVFVTWRWYQGLDAQRTRHEQRLERATQLAARLGVPVSKPAPRLGAAGTRQVNEQIALLNRDWSALLAQLVPDSPRVRLLAMDANPATGAVRITGAAEAAVQANAYAERLQRGAVVRDVRLVLLERKPARVQFEITAQWTD
jgi:hypothetical protein